MPEDLDNPEEDQQGPKQLREALKREQERAAAAQAELDSLKRESAFRAAGLDLSNPQHAAMARGYDGEPAGIGEWVSTLGLTQPAPQGPTPEEQAALERIASASAGDQPGQPPESQADKDREMQELTDKSIRENWDNNRYFDEMRRISQKYGMPVQTMPVEHNFGASR